MISPSADYIINLVFYEAMGITPRKATFSKCYLVFGYPLDKGQLKLERSLVCNPCSVTKMSKIHQ